eukprot:1005369-Lingulodinium_polyedra.AAC.1
MRPGEVCRKVVRLRRGQPVGELVPRAPRVAADVDVTGLHACKAQQGSGRVEAQDDVPAGVHEGVP